MKMYQSFHSEYAVKVINVLELDSRGMVIHITVVFEMGICKGLFQKYLRCTCQGVHITVDG